MTKTKRHQSLCDPVCGMSVNPATASAKSCYNSVQVYFCSPDCKHKFDENPEKYGSKRKKGLWQRYLDRLGKATGNQPPACH